MKKISINIVLIILCFISIDTYGQKAATLSIGDPAPELKYSKWIKGNPIKSFEEDQLYVLEFWATWCGPCKAAMPHITKLQSEYKGKALFIGVGVWEKVPQGQPYESSLASVIKYVKGNDANMGYSVIADNNEQYMGNNWLKAAGENGIPSTFIVKSNKVIWIGHPNSLDSILPKIFANKYNMESFKVSFEKKAETGRDQAARMAAMVKPIDEAIKSREFQKSFELMEKLKVEQPQFKVPMEMMKLRVLVENFSLKDVQEFVAKWDYKSSGSLVLAEIYTKDKLPKDTYLWAANNFGSTEQLNNPVIFDALATCYAKGGDYKSAVTCQQRALELGEQALKNGTMVGTIMDYTIKEYQKKLKQYKVSLK